MARLSGREGRGAGAAAAVVPAEGGELRLAEAEWFPLRSDHDADPLRSLLGGAGGLGQGEAAAVQVLARPVTARRLGRCHKAARALRSGVSTTPVGRLLDLVTPGPAARSRPSDDPTRAHDVRAILDKAAGPGWEVVVRYGVAAAGDGRHPPDRLRRPGDVLAERRIGRGDLLYADGDRLLWTGSGDVAGDRW